MKEEEREGMGDMGVWKGSRRSRAEIDRARRSVDSVYKFIKSSQMLSYPTCGIPVSPS